jgi:hypothetical protein
MHKCSAPFQPGQKVSQHRLQLLTAATCRASDH